MSLTHATIFECVILSYVRHYVSTMIRPFSNHVATVFLRYPLYITVMVFDDWRNDIPLTFFVMLRTREQDLHPLLLALHQRVQNINSDWNLFSIIVDNAWVEIHKLGLALLRLFFIDSFIFSHHYLCFYSKNNVIQVQLTNIGVR